MVRRAFFFAVGMIVAACTGGGSSDATSSGTTSSGAASSGASTSGSTSSGSPAEGSVTPNSCTELPDGGTVSTSLGGSQASQTEVQAALDFAAVAASSARELTTLCGQIAKDLGTAQGQLDTANAEMDDAKRVEAVCQLATNAIAAARGSDPVDPHASAPDCTVPPTTSCEAGCVPPSSNCTAMCGVAASAKASCPAPNVSATGASSSTLTATLNAHYGAVLSIYARVRGMAKVAGNMTSAISSVTDIKPACIPPVISTVARSVENLNRTAEATSDLMTAVGSG